MNAPHYVALEHEQPGAKDWVVVNWCLFNVCNFKCSYCPPSLHSGSMKGFSLDTILNFCRRVVEQSPEKKVFFEFTGGEVTHYRDFLPLVRNLKAMGTDTGIISNGSKSLEFWVEARRYLDHICLSFHPEQGKAEHFLEVVRLVNETTTVHVNVMMLPAKFDECHQLAQDVAFSVGGVSVSMQPLLEDMRNSIFNYTPAQLDVMQQQQLDWNQSHATFAHPKKPHKVYRGQMALIDDKGQRQPINTPELIAQGLNNWNGWDCWAGVENIVVDMDGFVYRGWCQAGGPIGIIKDPNFRLREEPVRCTFNSCPCGLDIMCTKRKPKT